MYAKSHLLFYRSNATWEAPLTADYYEEQIKFGEQLPKFKLCSANVPGERGVIWEEGIWGSFE